MSISGNLNTMPFADLLQWVSTSRKTGTLAIDGADYAKKVYFQDGLVVASASENPKEFLSYYLVGWNYVGEEELQELLEMQDRHGALLGELLVIVGKVAREELIHILQVKTSETIYDLFLKQEGEFRFLENILPSKKFQPLSLPADMLILEGVRRQDEWTRVKDVIPTMDWKPKVVRAVDMQSLGEIETAMIREMNGESSLERIALACRVPGFFVLEFVYQGLAGEMFVVKEPGAEEVAIPGFSKGAWRLILKDAEKALASGDLHLAYRRLSDLAEKFVGNTQAMELARGIERKIVQELEKRSPSEDAILKLAVPPDQLMSLPCSPQEGFMLSRVDGRSKLGQILNLVPGTELEVRLMVDALIRRELLNVDEGT
ncbi:MAG: DUF4388 domain-containing protein [bacterium]|nr:DUF4388 domain-containing protein [bacterium]